MAKNDLFYIPLENRGRLILTGADTRSFLQNLITNDMNLLAPERSLYACLLSPQGKFLHDFFIHDYGDYIVMDCEGGERAHDLAKRLSLYKLRADVQIEAQPENTVYAIFGSDQIGQPDPRHEEMGYRSFEKPEALEQKPFAEWDSRRITLAIPDGSRDLVVGNSTMDEAHMDQLNAISYDKGCYLGQELTARMHYRGLGKKHLQTVKIAELPEGAELRSSCGELGLALVRGKVTRPEISKS